MESFEPTPRTQVRRIPKRAVYEREQVYAILDEGYVCHVGFVSGGRPCVIPTSYVRCGDRIYIHGSAASRMVRVLAEGVDLCLTVTLLDGIVLARSAFHHSMNYRSVVLFGRARLVGDDGEKMEAFRCFVNRMEAGRWDHARWPNELEMKATSVLAVPIDEVSAKVRTGPPIDDEEDYALPVWAGVIPLKLQPGEPVADER